MPKSLRILYATGPGDVAGTYTHWIAGRDDPSQVCVTYSSQFFELCRKYGHRAYVISPHERTTLIKNTTLTVRHFNISWRRRSSLRFHCASLIYAAMLNFLAVIKRADVAIVTSGTHWFLLWPMRMFGVRVIPSLHTLPFSEQHTRRLVTRVIERMNAAFFRRCCNDILVASSAIAECLGARAKYPAHRITLFLPLYRKDAFSDAPAPAAAVPLRVLFAGRIEREKGVFDLLETARDLRDRGHSDIVFDVCGTGGAMAPFRSAIIEARMEGTILCHGHCSRELMRTKYQDAYVTIVPTRSECGEGFNQVVVESVLAGRPVIASTACPAVEYVREATYVVEQDSPGAYRDAILALRSDKALYESKRAACRKLREQFVDPRLSWGAVLERILTGSVEGEGSARSE